MSSVDLSGARVLVAHEWLLDWAGAERQLEEIVRLVPHADVIVGASSPRVRANHEVARRARETWLARIPGVQTNHRLLIPLQYAAFANIDTRGYDLVISSSAAFGKAIRSSGGRPHVCYCYSPPRYLWGGGRAFRRQETAFVRTALQLGKLPLRILDRRSARSVTHFAGISSFVVDRIRRAYGRDARVIYPAVRSKLVARRAAPREDFVLSLGRLVAYKRIDVAIQAAERLGVRLVIAGTGPDRERLQGFAGANTTFLGSVDEATAGDLMERCRAFVFCAEEDFGIAPLEANAHGAPVVGLGRGALLETMTPDTAVFFDDAEPDKVAAAIESALGRAWSDERLRANAERFGPDRFHAEFGALLSEALR